MRMSMAMQKLSACGNIGRKVSSISKLSTLHRTLGALATMVQVLYTSTLELCSMNMHVAASNQAHTTPCRQAWQRADSLAQASSITAMCCSLPPAFLS